MSPSDKNGPSSPGGNRPPGRPGTTGSNPAYSPSPSAPSGIRSAARLQPLQPPAPQGLTKARVKEGATETLLNSVGLLSDVVDDFKSSDRFFKYKAMVVASWLLLSISSVIVACPSQVGPSNDINAALVVGGEPSRPIYMVKNDGEKPWQDVEITVNGSYRAVQGTVKANGDSITLSPVMLFDQKGNKAPPTLVITDIEVHAGDPEGTAKLLAGGALVH